MAFETRQQIVKRLREEQIEKNNGRINSLVTSRLEENGGTIAFNQLTSRVSDITNEMYPLRGYDVPISAGNWYSVKLMESRL